MSSVVISGDTSGAITLSAPAVAGTNTITLPAATGTVVLTGTTPTLNGITFPATQVPSADANTLDDYEEGSFTPTLIDNSNNQPTTYGSQIGRYTKIGNLVTVQIYVSVSVKGGTISGNVSIGGLPFTSINIGDSYNGAVVSYWGTMGTSFVWLSGFVNPNNTKITLYQATAASASLTAMQASSWTTNSDIIVACTYRTA